MKKLFIIGVILFIIAILGSFFYQRKSSQLQHKKILNNNSIDIENKPTEFEEALGLALKGIQLVQGENGIELWRLKASWAQISQDGDTIEVNNPIIQYILGDGSKKDFIEVSADKGKVTEKQKFIILWGNVVITKDQKSITGENMTYDTTSRILLFPDGVSFHSPIVTGSAENITWHLESNVIKATGNVKTTFIPEKRIEKK